MSREHCSFPGKGTQEVPLQRGDGTDGRWTGVLQDMQKQGFGTEQTDVNST